ncbi:TCDD-inducible poly-like [Scleropages formosus]|uniref:TCDD-inducible poly-like n=1 Tax=Scleropages formosus TaxID=113540 RepID=A0A0P7U8X6_SCLFO|nr:TCDD-inducible poly-like [Scleropages formosus]
MMAAAMASEVPLKKRKFDSLSMGGTEDHISCSLFSTSNLLLHIPPHCNSSLPVWQCMRRGQVKVAWNETPYSINICITPLAVPPVRPPLRDQPPGPLSSAPPAMPHKGAEAQRITDDHPQPAVLSHSQTITVLSPHSLCSVALVQPLNMGHLLPRPQDLPLVPGSGDAPAPKSGAKPAGGPPVALIQPVPKAEWVQQAYFHTRSMEHVSICDDFLLGCCPNRSDCAQHHTPYPFHWQLRRHDTHQWISTSHTAQLKLERLYCDVERDHARLSDTTKEFTLHFDTMMIKNSERYDAARRLSNTSDPKRNPHFPTEWKFCWRDCFTWQCYRNDVSKELLTKMEAGETWCRFFIGQQEYEVDLTNLTQRNLSTGYERKVRCRPTFRSPLSIKSHLRTVILSEASQSSCQVHPNFNLDPLAEFLSWYPPVWTPVHNKDFSLVEVPFGTEVYQKVHGSFHSTMLETKVEIVSIQQVQNIFQWDKYRRQKEHMLNRHPHLRDTLERYLFHGTTEDAAKDICWNNFDPRVSGKNGVVYGHGSYFARDASYSDSYAQASTKSPYKHMFLAKVLVGNMSLGKRKYCRPPPLEGKVGRYEAYDTCVNHLNDPTVFVVFDNCQCYPYYLIKYKPLSDSLDAFK